MKKILLIGGGGHCKSVLDTLLNDVHYDEIGIVDKQKDSVLFQKVHTVGCDDDLKRLKEEGYLYAFVTIGSVGDYSLRQKLYNKIEELGFIIPTIIDSSAIVSKNTVIGRGVFIGKNAVVNADTTIGDAVIINSSSVVEHDCRIDSFAHISPSATLCGNVSIGAGTHIGANAVVIQGIKVGKDTIIGAGSVVINDIEDNKIVVGNPAKPIKK